MKISIKAMSEIVCGICKNQNSNDNYIQPHQIRVEVINQANVEH